MSISINLNEREILDALIYCKDFEIDSNMKGFICTRQGQQQALIDHYPSYSIEDIKDIVSMYWINMYVQLHAAQRAAS